MLAFLAALSIPTHITWGSIEKLQKTWQRYDCIKNKESAPFKKVVRALVVSKDQ